MVKVSLLRSKPYLLAAIGLRLTRAPLDRPIEEIEREFESEEKAKRFVRKVYSYGHRIPADFCSHALVVDRISRAGSIYGWRNVNSLSLLYGAGLETSFRWVEPSDCIAGAKTLWREEKEAYLKALQEGIPKEDARFLLSEGTLTRIIWSMPPRYLGKLANAYKIFPLEEFVSIGKRMEKLIEEEFDLRIEEKPTSEWRCWGRWEEEERDIRVTFSRDPGEERPNLHSLSLEMRVQGSMSLYAQLVRERQFLAQIEPWESISRKRCFVLPPSLEKIEEIYKEIAEKAVKEQEKLLEQRNPNFIYQILLGQQAIARLHAKSAGIVETARARSCYAAQWEIRSKLGLPLAEKIARYGFKAGPRCWVEKSCREPKKVKEGCPAFKRIGKLRLEELLRMLEQRSRTFSLR
jgi:thymidylate synthase ThyX